MSIFFCVDIESIGLHGEGFAVGYVVVDSLGTEIESATFACPPDAARGTDSDRAWVTQHVPPLSPTHATPREVRAAFWQRWLHWSALGAQMVADCAWPVEARFLAACVDDHGADAAWQGPYPLLDVSALATALGLDPRAAGDRLADELPQHDPLADARHCARLWRQYSRLCASTASAGH